MPLIAEFDELAVVGFIDVIGADPFEYVAEQIELPVSVRGGGLCARSERNNQRAPARATFPRLQPTPGAVVRSEPE